MKDIQGFAAKNWSPIADMPADWAAVKHVELSSLSGVWRDWRNSLRAYPHDGSIVRNMGKIILREVAVETGHIENLYVLTREVTQSIVRNGISAALIPHGLGNKKTPEEIAQIIQDQHDAMEGIYDFVAGGRELSGSYIKQLHGAITQSQGFVDGLDMYGRPTAIKLNHGVYKKNPNSVQKKSGKYLLFCPPEHVDMEMERLVEMHRAHTEEGVAPEVEAAWLHERFVSIHPFQDGNGRVSRCLASLVLMREELLPLVVRKSERDYYFGLLNESRGGNLAALANFVGERQCESLAAVMGREAAPQFPPDVSRRWSAAHATADMLAGDIGKYLTRAFGGGVSANEIKDGKELGQVAVDVAGSAPDVSFCADDYIRAFRVSSGEIGKIPRVLAIVGFGKSPCGLIAGHWLPARGEMDGAAGFLDKRGFLVNYYEPPQTAEQRFVEWLDSSRGNVLPGNPGRENSDGGYESGR